MSEDLKAISIKQPWAWLVGRGLKTIETRTRWNYGHRGPIAIHASLSEDTDWVYNLKCSARCNDAVCNARWHRGCIIAMAALEDVIDCTEEHASRALCHCVGMRGLVFGWAHLLAQPVPCRGSLGVWSVPDPVAQDVRRQLRSRAPSDTGASVAALRLRMSD